MTFTKIHFILIFILITFPHFANSKEVDPNKEYRVALVIGNSGYKNSPLKNPSNDAKDIADALQELGFEVVFGVDLNKEQINQKVSEFSPLLEKADVAFFYFAGHGLQYNGVNYLVPVSYNIGHETEIPREALSTNDILQKMDDAGNAVNIVILDACRNNPFKSEYQVAKRNLNIQNNKPITAPSSPLMSPINKQNRKQRSSSAGLSRINGPSGSLIAYATAPGNVAADGDGKNGLYTLHLLEYMQQSGLSIERVFKKVRIGVMEDTKGEQIPWENSSLFGDFYFVESDEAVSKSMFPSLSVVDKTAIDNKKIEDYELQFWGSVETAQSSALYQAYLKKYPQGHFVEIAKIKLESLTKAKTSEQVVAVSETVIVVNRTNDVQGETFSVTEQVQPKIQATKEVAPKSQYKLFTDDAFVKISSGCFTMGSPFGEQARQNDELDHEVCINEDFEMGKYEVTQAQWREVMGRNPAYFKACGHDCPVERVSWNDIKTFISYLNSSSDQNYRLPTEAQWEYAARSDTATSTYVGDIELEGSNNAPGLNDIAWYSGNSKVKYKGGKFCEDWEDKQFSSIRCGTHKVGKKQANSWGLYDMIGNVWELTEDWYGSFSSRDKNDPRGAKRGDLKVAKGGNWSESLQQNRAASRYGFAVKEKSNNLGFRLVRK